MKAITKHIICLFTLIAGCFFIQTALCQNPVPKIEGVYQRSLDFVVLPLVQSDGKISAKFESGGWAHVLTGVWDPAQDRFNCNIIRTNKFTGKVTKMQSFIRPVDDHHMQLATYSTDGKDDLATNYSDDYTWDKK